MFNELRRVMKEELSYPDNHDYDPEYFRPSGKLIERLEVLRENAPELFQGGGSLLEIGSNKGFFCLTLASEYEKVVGYDKAPEYVSFSRSVAEAHKIKNVTFCEGGFRGVPFTEMYDVVYVGNCHHYFFFDCARNYAPPLLFLKKLAAVTKHYLIIDGPFEMKDPAVTKLAKEGCWSGEVKGLYTFEQYEKALAPQFRLVRKADNGLGRETAVFERACENIPHIDGTNLRRELIKKGLPLDCNPRRGPDSGFIYNNWRYKFDMNPLPDGVFLVLNALDYFPKTHQVIEYREARVGDISEWIYGEVVEDSKEILAFGLRINMILGSVGLVELDFERSDFKRVSESRIYDVDVDMVRHLSDLKPPKEGERSWQDMLRGKTRRLGLKESVIETLIENIHQPNIFKKIIEEGDYYVNVG